MLLFSGTQRGIKIALGLLSFGSLFWVGLTLMGQTDGSLDSHWINQVGVYLLGNWPSPFSIVVVVDKLTVTMLLLTTLLALLDRKSTRLNSSHVAISYAVFCLKKKREDKLAEDHITDGGEACMIEEGDIG